MPTDRLPISTEARGRLRALWATVAADATRVERAVARVPRETTQDALRAFRKGSERAIDRIAAAIPAEQVYRAPRQAAWRYLKPAPADQPPALVVWAALLNSAGRPGLHTEEFGLAVGMHALGRLLDRSGMLADPKAAVVEAHAALMRLYPEEGERLLDLPRIRLPSAGGLFLAAPKAGAVRCFATTWIPSGLLHGDQERDLASWRALIGAAA